MPGGFAIPGCCRVSHSSVASSSMYSIRYLLSFSFSSSLGVSSMSSILSLCFCFKF